MSAPRIFISHSAKESYAVKARDKIFAVLDAAGFDVFVDVERLKAGQEWRNELYMRMYRSHGGVILFSEHASPWTLPPAETASGAGCTTRTRLTRARAWRNAGILICSAWPDAEGREVGAPHGQQAEPEFRPSEYLKVLLRIRRYQPRRYAREVSTGQQRQVELYEQRKAQAAAAPARRAKAA